jgi:hypothetical protein
MEPTHHSATAVYETRTYGGVESMHSVSFWRSRSLIGAGLIYQSLCSEKMFYNVIRKSVKSVLIYRIQVMF